MAVPVQRFFTGRTFLRQKCPLAIHNWWPGDIFVLILFFHFIPFIRTCHTILAGALGNSHTAQRGLPELRWDGTSHGVHDPNGLVDGRDALYARQGKLRRDQRIGSAHGVPVLAGILHQAADGVTDQTQDIDHGKGGRVHALPRSASKKLHSRRCSHGAGRPHLRLAAALCSRCGGVSGDQIADGSRVEQCLADLVIGKAVLLLESADANIANWVPGTASAEELTEAAEKIKGCL